MPYDNLVYDQFIDEYVLLLFFIIDLHDGRKYKSGDDAYIDAKEPIDVRPYGSCHTSVFGSPGKTIWHPPYVGLCPRSSRESSACLTFPHTTSTTWHQEMPCIGPYPVTTPVIFLTGPFIGYPVTDQLTGPVTSPVTGH